MLKEELIERLQALPALIPVLLQLGDEHLSIESVESNGTEGLIGIEPNVLRTAPLPDSASAQQIINHLELLRTTQTDGKTILHYETSSGEAVFIYTDGTYISISAEHEGDDQCCISHDRFIKLQTFFSLRDLVQFNLITPAHAATLEKHELMQRSEQLKQKAARVAAEQAQIDAELAQVAK